jgi:cytochrome oxidase Cu insertion factor (SCO1/SenC/PrrC family)
MGRLLRPAALVAAAWLCCGVATARSDGAARRTNEPMSGSAPIGGDFALTDHNGRKRSLADFRGKLVLLYFGYTACPDVCAKDLAQIGRAVRSLGNDSLQVQPLFVTLDPARDTGHVLRKYVTAFHPRFIALRGTQAETRRVARSFKVFHEPAAATAKPRDGLLGPTTYTFLLDREGRYVASFAAGTPAERMASRVREQLAHRLQP